MGGDGISMANVFDAIKAIKGANDIYQSYKRKPRVATRRAYGYGGTSRRRYKKTGYASTRRRGYKRTGYKRKYKRRVSPRKTTLRKLARKVKTLEKETEQALGVMTYRHLTSSKLTCATGAQSTSEILPVSLANLEIVLGQCKFFDPANPGTLVVASEAAGTYQRNARFDSVHTTATFRNSYQVGVTVKVYLNLAKDDTSTDPRAAWSAGINDSTNKFTINALGTYPTDSNLAKDLWSWKVLKTKHLMPGQAMTVSHTTKAFEYDSATADTHAMKYQREWGGSPVLTYVITGDLGHDSGGVANQEITMPCAIDVMQTTTYKVTYAAGININYVYVDNERATNFTTGGVEGMKMTDNQSYSVS